ncbi:Down syndrome cell adhesion molecule-like protein Dscam2 [Diaphorina citri]|uniref:Down syndrome cell adhesion molecule-like protein Dscam2 n=1 Tax=Diaphorina citri TaxID=121845 RepID=A0A3Q0IL86_DIACI|nr:Down syndrome cell adhesion molecule-like protein Dscam2 [Diaphorina citri]
MLRCNTPGFVRDFISVTSWIQDSTFNIYPSPRGDGKYHMLSSGELIIHQVDESDRYRSYQCRGVNKLTGASLLSVNRGRLSLTENKRLLSAAKMFEKHRILNVKKDESVILPCSAQGNPLPTIKWYKQDSPVEESDRIQRIGSSLSISHVEESDSGVWNCVANNSEGQDKMQLFIQTEKNKRLLSAAKMFEKHRILNVKKDESVILPCSAQVVVDVGHRIELHCRVSPKRLSSAKAWLKDGLVLRRNSDEVLVLDRVQREDAGMYQCHVSADDDSAQMSAQVILGASHPQLIYKFIQQTLQPGPPVSLKCIATGNPTPHISWKLDGYPLAGDRFVMGQYMSLHGDVISHVNISSVRVEDSGIYQCTATNRVGSQTHSADMRVYDAPGQPQDVKLVTSNSRSIKVHSGDRAGVQCLVTKGDPPLTISWLKNGLPILSDAEITIRSSGEYTSSLSIATLSTGHSGNYTCVASNTVASDNHSSNLRVNEYTSSLSIATLSTGHSGNYTCVASNTVASDNHSSNLRVNELMEGVRTQVACVVQSGDLPLSLQWYKNGLAISQPDISITSAQYSSILSIERVARGHAGNYTCVATNAAKSTQATAQLIVAVPPHWILTPRGANITRDSTYILNCQADGFPQPTVVWRKLLGKQSNDYQEVSGRGLSVHSNGTIFIKQALPEHAGQYLCEASNGIGSDVSATVTIVVLNPPEFDIKSSQLSGKRGAVQTLTCKCRGDSPMTMSWSKENSLPLHYKSRYQMREYEENGFHISELTIPNTEKTDAGMYTCTASNPYGRDQSTIHFTVQDAPGQPQDVKLVTSNSRSIKVSWSPPSEESVLQYIVQYRMDSEDPAAIISFGEVISIKSRQSISLRCLSVGSPAPKRSWHKSDAKSLFAIQADGSLEISSIEPSHSGNYTCSVSNNLGSDSITYSLLVLMPPSAVILQLVDKGSSWLDLEWRVENNGGSPIRGFILKFKRSDLTDWNDITLPRDMHSYKLKDLICVKKLEDWSRQARVSVQSAESSTSPEASPRCLRHRTDVSCDSLSHSNFSESDFTNMKRHRRSNPKKYSIAV